MKEDFKYSLRVLLLLEVAVLFIIMIVFGIHMVSPYAEKPFPWVIIPVSIVGMFLFWLFIIFIIGPLIEWFDL